MKCTCRFIKLSTKYPNKIVFTLDQRFLTRVPEPIVGYRAKNPYKGVLGKGNIGIAAFNINVTFNLFSITFYLVGTFEDLHMSYRLTGQ